MDDLLAAVTSRYSVEEFPTLWWQFQHWSQSRPLAGLRVLDATPVFHNTLTKYLALVAAGAEVSVGLDSQLPSDPAVVGMLPDLGISVAGSTGSGFDVVLDCAGHNAAVPSEYGYVELTRSGVARYTGSGHPVFVADSGVIKRIETTLGTSDGFVRALEHFGHPIPPDAHIVCFGLGKVGAGVAHAARSRGAWITAIDPALADSSDHDGIRIVDPTDRVAVRGALDTAWCVVAATGMEAGLDGYASELVNSQALLVNLGAEDEFGPRVSADRVLNEKVAINFALAEPTRLRYLDATMALSNSGALEVTLGRCGPGLNLPPHRIESHLLAVTREYGLIGRELDTLPMSIGVTS